MKIFLSYCDRSEKEFAKELAARLSQAGYEAWTHNSVYPGDNFYLDAGKALENSDAMAVLLSPESVESDQVWKEIKYALGVMNYKDRVIPVIVGPGVEIPWILKKFVPITAVGDADLASREIINRLRAMPKV